MFVSFLPVLFTMFIVVDPFGLVPMYIGLTSRLSAEEKRKTIRKAVGTAFFVLLLFILAGKWILQLLRIQPGSFFIAGGIMLFIVSLEMLFGQPTKSKVSKQEHPQDDDGDERSSVAVFPLAIPMLAGPGAITSILLYTSSEVPFLSMVLMLVVAVALVLATAVLSMGASDVILRILGRSGVSVVERIMGLLLSGMSVQFVYDGLGKLGLLSGGSF